MQKINTNKKSSNVVKVVNVGIIGCGWLGLALANKLTFDGHQVIATVTKDEKVQKLNGQGLNVHKLSLPSAEDELNQHKVFLMSSLVICIPPRLKQNLNESAYGEQVANDYPLKIQQLVQAAQQGNVKQIILISTTAVYNGLSGRVTEQSAVDFSAKKVKTLFSAEQEVLKFKGQKSIVRFAGLVGPERHPGRFLSANRPMKNPDACINLIHQADAVGIIVSLLQTHTDNHETSIFNGVSAVHVSRKQFYQAAAAAIGLSAPQFSDEISPRHNKDQPITSSKQISGEKVQRTLAYDFMYPNLMTWLKDN